MAQILSRISSNTLYTAVPELNGTNWNLWSEMTYMKNAGYSHILFTLCPGTVVDTPAASAPGTSAGGTTSAPRAPGGTGSTVACSSTAATDEALPHQPDSDSTTTTSATSKGDGPVVSKYDIKQWDTDNDKAMGAIKLRVNTDICQDIKGLMTARKMWRQLARDFGKASTAEVFNDFKRLLNISIPHNTHPGPALEKILTLFKKMEATEGEVKIPVMLKAMSFFLKCPSRYNNLVEKETTDTINNLGQTNFKTTIWEGKDITSSRLQANCLTAIKHKLSNPNFNQQQQQPQHQNNGRSGSGTNSQNQGNPNWKGKGKAKPYLCHGACTGKQAQGKKGQVHMAQGGISAMAHTIPSVQDVHHPFFHETEKKFDTFFPATKLAINLAHDMDIKPSASTSHTPSHTLIERLFNNIHSQSWSDGWGTNSENQKWNDWTQ
ncbi:hypothetical protein D9758_006981 [Tetrapyrgos nigripes]|uniref:Uncharacterized protein n=1 Tax=Tetrapyrgos nigripes TaxID=182062 RepID=A0A8H5GSZ0_9AGAR|nr:hypothetical protein D9758_006981 [Tetrapyrgos nigripes]